jgi:hypothetical protein
VGGGGIGGKGVKRGTHMVPLAGIAIPASVMYPQPSRSTQKKA